MVNKNSIKINGKEYDARTGKLISRVEDQKLSSSNGSATNSIAGPKVVDGFIKPKNAHHKTDKSKTLMRKSVKKPVNVPEPAHKAILAPDNQGDDNEETTLSHGEKSRAKRAQSIEKSSLVSRFGFGRKNEVAQPSTNAHTPPIGPSRPINPPQSAIVKSDNVIKKEHLINKAIENSNHHQKYQKHHRRTTRHRVAKKLGVSTKAVNISAVTLSLALIIGFIAYQNIPNLNMRIASTRAGFNASLPGYKPSGFSMERDIESSPGQVVVNFRSNSDDRNFRIIEKVSNWNSEVLLEKYITQANKAYQTYQDNGKTIYLYDDNNATWVDSGVWYRIEGTSSLSNNQLLDIASSI